MFISKFMVIIWHFIPPLLPFIIHWLFWKCSFSCVIIHVIISVITITCIIVTSPLFICDPITNFQYNPKYFLTIPFIFRVSILTDSASWRSIAVLCFDNTFILYGANCSAQPSPAQSSPSPIPAFSHNLDLI